MCRLEGGKSIRTINITSLFRRNECSTSFVKAAVAHLQEKRQKHINQSWLDLDLTLKWHMHAGEQHHHRFLRSAPFYAWAVSPYLCGFQNENSYLRLDTFCCWQSECELLDFLGQHGTRGMRQQNLSVSYLGQQRGISVSDWDAGQHQHHGSCGRSLILLLQRWLKWLRGQKNIEFSLWGWFDWLCSAGWRRERDER